MKINFTKLDNFKWVFFPSMVLPLISLSFFYLSISNRFSVNEFFTFLTRSGTLTKLLSLSVVPNLLLFFIFIWLDYLKGARGVLAATFITAIIIIMIQVVF